MEEIEKEAEKLAKEYEAQEQQKQELAEAKKVMAVTDANGKIDMEKLEAQHFAKRIENGESLHNITQDFAKAQSVRNVLTDESAESEKFRKDLAQETQEALKESFKQETIKERTKTIDEKQKKAEAFYNSVRPILEFDFSNLIKGTKKEEQERQAKSKEEALQKDKQQEEKQVVKDTSYIYHTPTYADRSYGIPLMVAMLLILTLPYFACSIILAIFNGINAVFEEVATFGRIAKILTRSILAIAIGLLIIYAALKGIDAVFGTHILPF